MAKITDAAEFNRNRDAQSYPPIPEDATLFFHDYGYKPVTAIHEWQWSATFNKWSALVTFACGWHGFTYPKTY